jgi:hypothetical protein
MFYKIEEFSKTHPINILASNIDIVCDFLPIVSTVTNVARIIFKTLWGVIVLVSCMTSCTIFLSKSFVEIALLKDKKQIIKNFDAMFEMCLNVNALWISNFFTFHYFKKSYIQSMIHATPFIGNLAAIINRDHRQFHGVKSDFLKELENWHIKQKMATFKLYPHAKLPMYMPEALAMEPDVVVANLKVNPYNIKNVPDFFFKNDEFIENVIKALTSALWLKDSDYKDFDLKNLLEDLIKKCHSQQKLLNLILPIENLYMNRDLIDLVTRNPLLLWMLPNIEFYQQANYISPLVSNHPQMIVRIGLPFLKRHPSIFNKALSLAPELSLCFEDIALMHAFSVKKELLKDPVFLSCLKFKPSLKNILIQILNRRALLSKFKMV